MNNLSFDKPAGILVKTTLVDFPGLVAGSFFLKGCNLYCPYCYNVDLISDSDNDYESVPFESINDLFNHLKRRQGILKGIVISGGEPLINPYTKEIIITAKELDYKVKIDTNGILPQKLEELLSDSKLKPDFVAMDIKTSPARYSRELCRPLSKYFGNDNYFIESLTESIKLLSNLPADSREFRTVLVPPLIQKEDIYNIAQLLPKDASWQFAQFRNQNCLNPEFNKISPYLDSEIKELIDFAKSMIPGAALR